MSGVPLRDVVFIVSESVPRTEFQYALRSLDFLPHNNVFLIGGRPDWVRNVEHVPFRSGSKWRNLDDKFRALRDMDFLTPEVYYDEDDYFILEPVEGEIPNYYKDTLRERVDKCDITNAHGGWSNSLRATYKVLRDRGYEDPISFDVHIPMVVERHLIDPTVPAEQPLRWRSIIGNYSNRTPTRVAYDPKCVHVAETGKVLGAGVPFLSSNEGTFRDSGVEAYLELIHPLKCRYER